MKKGQVGKKLEGGARSTELEDGGRSWKSGSWGRRLKQRPRLLESKGGSWAMELMLELSNI